MILHAELSVDPDLNASSHSNFTEILVIQICDLSFTSRPAAVTDVFDSGRNVAALRPGRRVVFRSLVPGIADDIYWLPIIFVTPIALELLKLGPNSKRGK